MGCSPTQSPPHCINSTVTAHPSTASVPITVLLYDGLLLCGFNVAIKGSMFSTIICYIADQAAKPFTCVRNKLLYYQV